VTAAMARPTRHTTSICWGIRSAAWWRGSSCSRKRPGSLTLMSSGPGALTGPRAELLRAVLAELEPGVPNGLGAAVQRLWYTQLEPAAVADGVPADIVDFLRTRMLRSCPTGLWSMGRGLLGCPDRTSALAALGAPLLVVYGENDDAW